jgi:hypothetical protein
MLRLTVRKSLSLLIVSICAVSVLSLAGCGEPKNPIGKIKYYTSIKLPSNFEVIYNQQGLYKAQYTVLDTKGEPTDFLNKYNFSDAEIIGYEYESNFHGTLSSIDYYFTEIPEEFRPDFGKNFFFRGGYSNASFGYTMFYFPDEFRLYVKMIKG